MKILITTGVYPPKLGGPAQYAKNLEEVWRKEGHKVVVRTYNIENSLPTGIRHLWFFFKIVLQVFDSDFVLALDTFSVGFPTVLAGKIFKKKIIIRTGGDFLWEGYVERTNQKILLRDFYNNKNVYLNLKEKIIFSVTKWTLKNTAELVFSTKWQKDIFISAYDLDESKTKIIENYYGPKEGDLDTNSYDFIASSRNLVWKNIETLRSVFDMIQKKNPQFSLLTSNFEFNEFMSKIKNCYAVVLVSLGDISPNMILDAIRFNRPFICTKEVGIIDRIKDAGIFVDPMKEGEIEDAVITLLDPIQYNKAREKVRNFKFVHTWQDIGQEFLNVYNSTK